MRTGSFRSPRRLAALVAVVGLLAAACGGGASPAGTATSPGGSPTGKPIKVALVTPSATNDLAFSQAMYDALNRLKSQYNLDLQVSDNMFVVNDAAAAMRNYATSGVDLIVANGSQYGATVQALAKQFPNVTFAWGTAGDTFGLPNVFAYDTRADQGGYVQGVMAAMLTKSKVIGVVGPIAVGDGKLYIDGFVAGVKAQDPTVKVRVNYIGSFSDVSLASEAARSFVSAGADVMTGTAQMVVGAIGVCKANNIAWFGTQSNQASLAPQQVVSSQVYHWEVALKQILDEMRAGVKGGKAYDITLANGGEVIEFNPDYNLPADVKAKAEETIKGIEDGSITLPG
jgi:basic membrane lipoprotein Med (substrate-binding protein (PBP1-ABC) superfamily)